MSSKKKKKKKQKQSGTPFGVDDDDYFRDIILSLNLTFLQCILEQIQNSYDNGATNLCLKLYDKNRKLIPIKSLDKLMPYYLVLEDDCDNEIKSVLMKSLKKKKIIQELDILILEKLLLYSI